MQFELTGLFSPFSCECLSPGSGTLKNDCAGSIGIDLHAVCVSFLHGGAWVFAQRADSGGCDKVCQGRAQKVSCFSRKGRMSCRATDDWQGSLDSEEQQEMTGPQ